MIYLGNGLYSESGPDVLAHGGPWKTHKYIAIKNGRYIYPGDVGGNKGKINWGAGSGSDPNNSKANNAFRRDTVSLATNPSKKTAYRKVNISTANEIYKPTPFTGERISARAYEAGSKQDAYLYKNRKNSTNGQRGAPPPGIDYKTGRDRHENRKQEKRLQYTDKYQSGVNSQGPSAAERAQRGSSNTRTSIPGTSRNTGAGSKNVKYTQYKPGAITKGTKWSTVDTKSKTKEYQDYYSRSAQEAGRAPTKKKKKKLKDYLFGKKGDTYSTTKTSNGNTIYKKIK